MAAAELHLVGCARDACREEEDERFGRREERSGEGVLLRGAWGPVAVAAGGGHGIGVAPRRGANAAVAGAVVGGGEGGTSVLLLLGSQGRR